MRFSISIVAVALSLSLASCGQSKKAEENAQTTVQKEPTKAALVKDIKAYILNEQKRNDGYFHVYDSVAKRPLKLKLEKVHNDKFSRLKKNTYFDCANFRGQNGKLYDIDIFMKWNGKAFKSTSRRMVHKVNNKPRYVWYEKDGVWKTKKPAKKKSKKTKMKDGHPAH